MSETIPILVLFLKYLFTGYFILGYQSFCLGRVEGGRGGVVCILCVLWLRHLKLYLLSPLYCLSFFSLATLKGVPSPLCLSFGGHFEMLLQCVTKVNFFLVFYLKFIVCVVMNFFYGFLSVHLSSHLLFSYSFISGL